MEETIKILLLSGKEIICNYDDNDIIIKKNIESQLKLALINEINVAQYHDYQALVIIINENNDIVYITITHPYYNDNNIKIYELNTSYSIFNQHYLHMKNYLILSYIPNLFSYNIIQSIKTSHINFWSMLEKKDINYYLIYYLLHINPIYINHEYFNDLFDFEQKKKIGLELLKKDKLKIIKLFKNFYYYNKFNYYDIEDFVLLAVKYDGLCLKYASNELKNNKLIVLAAINQTINSIIYASIELQEDKEIISAAIKKSASVYCLLTNNVKKDPNILFECIKKDPTIIQHAFYSNQEFFDDKNIALKLLNINGTYLSFVSNRLKHHTKILITAIRNNVLAYKYIPYKFSHDKNILKELYKHYNKYSFDHYKWNIMNSYRVFYGIDINDIINQENNNHINLELFDDYYNSTNLISIN